MSTKEETISRRDYARLSKLIYTHSGINLGTEKKTMLEVRIKRRLKELALPSYEAYCDYLFGHQGIKNELVNLIDVVTTNKTDFFREPKHFTFLADRALPELTGPDFPDHPLLIWSAGCSTGEEPYTLAIVLNEYALAHPGFRFKILATDISTTVLHKAQKGIYTTDVVSPVPVQLKMKYFLRSRDRNADRVRVVPELRHQVEFRHLNFMDHEFGLECKADAIFFRNVMIYFDRATQERIVLKLANSLLPGGYLFVGHSETLNSMNLPLVSVAPALYRRIDEGV